MDFWSMHCDVCRYSPQAPVNRVGELRAGLPPRPEGQHLQALWPWALRGEGGRKKKEFLSEPVYAVDARLAWDQMSCESGLGAQRIETLVSRKRTFQGEFLFDTLYR